MIVKRFNNFLLEKKNNNRLDTKIPVLEVIIDNDGKIAKDDAGNPIKGFVLSIKRKNRYKSHSGSGGSLMDIIVDNTWSHENQDPKHEYIGGVDKNGFLIGLAFNNQYRLLNKNGETVKNTNAKGIEWKRNSKISLSKPEYPDFVQDEPSGWVNIKIDMEVIRKIRRFSKNLSSDVDITGLKSKLEFLSNPDSITSNDIKTTTQKKMSCIILLKYLLEMKDHFNPASSGYLLESFIGGLVGGTVPDDNGKADVIGENGSDKYQIKFVDWSKDKGNIRILPPGKSVTSGLIEDTPDKKRWVTLNPTNRSEVIAYNKYICDYYIIALKKHNTVLFYILDSELPESSNESLSKYLIASGISLPNLKKADPFVTLNLSNLDNKIETTGKKLKESLNDLWTNISELEYNVETITTGVSKQNKLVSGDEYDKLYTNSNHILTEIKVGLKSLKGGMEGKE